MKALQLWFAALAQRERRLVQACLAVVLVALLWWVAIAPALATLRSAAQAHRQLDEQLQTMQSLASQAAQLKSQRALSQEEALRNLEASVKQTLGAGATLTSGDSRATLSLKGVNADALALWLGQARANARAVPTDAKLSRSAAGNSAGGVATSAASAASSSAGSTGSAASAAAWDGIVNLALPANK